jgi:hypothetical protein
MIGATMSILDDTEPVPPPRGCDTPRPLRRVAPDTLPAPAPEHEWDDPAGPAPGVLSRFLVALRIALSAVHT